MQEKDFYKEFMAVMLVKKQERERDLFLSKEKLANV